MGELRSKGAGLMNRMRKFSIALMLLSLLSCRAPAPKPAFPPGELAPRPPLRPGERIQFLEREFTAYPGDDGDQESLRRAAEKSLLYLSKKSSRKPARVPAASGELFTPARVERSLLLFREILINSRGEEFGRRVRQNFRIWEAARGDVSRPVLLTGYYEPVIEASPRPGGEYRFPIYRRPADLKELSSGEVLPGGRGKQVVRMERGRPVPYYSRQEIDSHGVLRGRGDELFWLKDPWERFVLHVQGSGQIRTPDGQRVRVGFAVSNGRPYRSIGRHLVERGLISEKELSLRRVREYLAQNPARLEETFNANERYVFFRVLAAAVSPAEGPAGALGVALTAGRSVATDLDVFPRGGLAYLAAQQPVVDGKGRWRGKKSFTRFVLNQDTGAAMRGPERVDLFCGSGEEAGAVAGEMHEEGRIYFLLAK